ncbi:MAG: MBL fold metallo-hydrolase [Balneolaceae bacterium]|nr:MBL fold metallo-hydrolase [Balneolaceae bacterium]
MSEQKLNKKVLLVSAYPSETGTLAKAVKNCGFRLIRHQSHPSEQLAQNIRMIHPDVIIWDGHSFDGSAMEFITILRNSSESHATPLYLVSRGNGDLDRYREQLQKLDHVTMVQDPFREEDLHRLLSDDLKATVSVKFWGVRGSTPCANKENIEYGGNTTCVQVELPFDEELLILDSGTGIRNLGNYLTKYQKQVSGHIFITHPHWDHIQGFPFFKPIYHPGNHFHIHMPPQETGGCREILSGHLTKTFFPVTLDMFDASLSYITQKSDHRRYNGYTVEYMKANHPINTAIYKLEIYGKTIVFAPDNELVPEPNERERELHDKLIAFCRDADILIHDAQYNLENYQNKREWGHSPWETVVRVARSAGVDHLFLTHHDPDSDDIYLAGLDQQIRREYGSQFRSVQMAREGVKVELEVTETVDG